jgi:hypothetical protein
VSIEATKSVSLEAIVSGSDVRIIGNNEMVLADLVLDLGNHRAIVGFRELRQLSGLEEFLVVLDRDHIMQFAPESDAHFIDLTLKPPDCQRRYYDLHQS